jgi:hypothetical protein
MVYGITGHHFETRNLSDDSEIVILFILYFKNYKRQMVSWNCKHVQHVKIYLPCNFEVNLITHLGVIALFSSFVGITGHNFGRGPSKDHSTKVWFKLALWLQRSWLKCEKLTDGRSVVTIAHLGELKKVSFTENYYPRGRTVKINLVLQRPKFLITLNSRAISLGKVS